MREKKLPELFENTRSHPVLIAAVRKLLELRELGQGLEDRFRDEADGSNFGVLSLGQDGDGLPFHQHNQAWLAHMYGAKIWYFLPTTLDLSSLPDDISRQTYMNPRFWSLEARKYFGSLEGGIMCRAEPGQVLIFPGGMFHATENIGESLSFGMQIGQTKVTLQDLKNGMENLSYLSGADGVYPEGAYGLYAASRLYGAVNEQNLNGASSKSYALLQAAYKRNPLYLSSILTLMSMHLEQNTKDGFLDAMDIMAHIIPTLDAMVKERILSQKSEAYVRFMICSEFDRGLAQNGHYEKTLTVGVAKAFGEQPTAIPNMLLQCYQNELNHHSEKDLHWKEVRELLDGLHNVYEFGEGSQAADSADVSDNDDHDDGADYDL